MTFTSPSAEYFHKVVDCQWACPAHTPVPQYIRLIAQKKYTEAYLVNWHSNQFPGILGRVCDRPCEPACRRGRVEKEPVAICRLKRVTADLKDANVRNFLPASPQTKNGKKIALIGAGPASLTVASDLLPLGYTVVLFEKEKRAGGAMFTQVPRFRLPTSVLDEEISFILDRGVECRFGQELTSLKALLDQKFDAIFIGTGAPVGRDLPLPGRSTPKDKPDIHVGVDFLASVSFGHKKTIKKNVVVIGGGNTAMDCARTAFRLGAEQVRVVAPESYKEMLASPWEKEDAQREGAAFVNHLLPKEFRRSDGNLSGVVFQRLSSCYDQNHQWKPIPSGEQDVFLPCEEVLIAIGQDAKLPFLDIELTREGAGGTSYPKVDPVTFQSSHPKVFFGGDAAWGPKNIIWAVAHGHEAASSIHLFCQGLDPRSRPAHGKNLVSQRMGLNQWSYDNAYSEAAKQEVPHHPVPVCKQNLNLEVELGFDEQLARRESSRCLNCDIQTVFVSDVCIECDACVDICPVDCLTITPLLQELGGELLLKAPRQNQEQALFIAPVPQTKRVMAKDENLCLHCGLCAERCPTGAWDMQAFTLT
ncbi:MAG: FAD-dependent oxidoreductase [Deltaproteobacteria bacterium]|nr:FAD-dependent oxidoreductase [Deltaproteobacteria bacterium]